MSRHETEGSEEPHHALSQAGFRFITYRLRLGIVIANVFSNFDVSTSLVLQTWKDIQNLQNRGFRAINSHSVSLKTVGLPFNKCDTNATQLNRDVIYFNFAN